MSTCKSQVQGGLRCTLALKHADVSAWAQTTLCWKLWQSKPRQSQACKCLMLTLLLELTPWLGRCTPILERSGCADIEALSVSCRAICHVALRPIARRPVPQHAECAWRMLPAVTWWRPAAAMAPCSGPILPASKPGSMRRCAYHTILPPRTGISSAVQECGSKASA